MHKPMKFKYQQRTKEQMRERANMRGGGFDTFIKPQYKLYKCRDGKNIIRILPPTWDNANHYGIDLFVNYNIGPDKASYLSLSKHKKGRDPIAEAQRQAANDGDEELAKKLQPTQRVLVWLIDRQDEDEGPQLWAMPFSKVDKAFINLSRDEDTGEVVYIDALDKGWDIRFYKEGKGLNTTYDASRMKLLGPKPISEDDDQMASWLEYIQEHPVPETLKFYDADYIMKIFGGAPAKAEDDDDDAEDEKPQRKARPAKRVEDDDDDDGETPAPKKLKAKTAPVDDDDDGDEPPPDDDEDEAPKAKGSIRERIAARRAAAKAQDQDDD